MPFRFFSFLFKLSLILHFSSASAESPVETILKKVKSEKLNERIERFSAQFLNSRYTDNPLGEGPTGKYDRGPLYRFDEFDCTTFVETVMALAMSKTASDFEKTLTQIRYERGQISFTTRNHFPCADWIPNNTEAGFVTDITPQIAGARMLATATAIVDKKSWYQNLPMERVRVENADPNLHATLRNEAAHISPQSYALHYLPLDAILVRKEVDAQEKARRLQEEAEFRQKRENAGAELALEGEKKKEFEKATHDQLVGLRLEYILKDADIDPQFLENVPSATILNVIRPNWKIVGTHMNVSHQGWIIRKNGVPYFRHVSRTGGERVKDVLLANYLRLCLLSPQIKGFHFLRVNEMGSALRGPRPNPIQK